MLVPTRKWPSQQGEQVIDNHAMRSKRSYKTPVRQSSLVMLSRAPWTQRGLDAFQQQSVVAAEHRKPVVHLLGVAFVLPMLEQRRRIAQRQTVCGRMNLQGEGNTPGPDRPDGFGHDPEKPSRTKHQRHRPP